MVHQVMVISMISCIFLKSQVAQGNDVLVTCVGLSFQRKLFPVGSQVLEVQYEVVCNLSVCPVIDLQS